VVILLAARIKITMAMNIKQVDGALTVTIVKINFFILVLAGAPLDHLAIPLVSAFALIRDNPQILTVPVLLLQKIAKLVSPMDHIQHLRHLLALFALPVVQSKLLHLSASLFPVVQHLAPHRTQQLAELAPKIRTAQ